MKSLSSKKTPFENSMNIKIERDSKSKHPESTKKTDELHFSKELKNIKIRRNSNRDKDTEKIKVYNIKIGNFQNLAGIKLNSKGNINMPFVLNLSFDKSSSKSVKPEIITEPIADPKRGKGRHPYLLDKN